MANKNDGSAPPAYPPYNAAQPYQQFDMHPVNPVAATGGGYVPPPQPPPARPQEVHYHEEASSDNFFNRLWRGDEEERGEQGGKKEGEEEEGLPGSGPGGAPQKYFTLDFESFFKEDKNTKTFQPIYKALRLFYRYLKLITYHFFVLLLGFFLVPIWAFVNGVTIFTLVWLWGPLLRITLVTIHAVAPIVTVPLYIFLGPVFEVFGYMFRQIRVRSNFSGGFGVNLSGTRPLGQEQNV